MTQLNPENFFEQAVGGGEGAPSAVLKALNDYVYGTIVHQQMVEAKKFGTDQTELDRDGNKVFQLLVILETDQRNWANVSKIPLVDPTDKSKGEKAASEDDGRRAVYIKPFTNIAAAVNDAIVAGTGEKGPLRNGGKLGVKVVELRDTGKGNPLKVHQAKYEPPTAAPASQDFFAGTSQASAETKKAIGNQDPWTGERTEEPPF